MLNFETLRQRDGWMLFPEHHESSLAVPMGSEATLGTPEGSSFRCMHMSTFGTGATGATFPNETRCDTRLFGLVSEVLLDPPGFHLGNFLAGFTTKALLLFGVLFDTGRVADYQLALISFFQRRLPLVQRESARLNKPRDLLRCCLTARISRPETTRPVPFSATTATG